MGFPIKLSRMNAILRQHKFHIGDFKVRFFFAFAAPLAFDSIGNSGCASSFFFFAMCNQNAASNRTKRKEFFERA